MESEPKLLGKGVATFLTLVLVVAVFLVSSYTDPRFSVLAVFILYLLEFVVIGKMITGRLFGILITEMNTMSFSRFQISLWTLIVLSGYTVAVLLRVHDDIVTNPLEMEIDWHIWALLGISGATMVGSPLVNSQKKQKEPKEKAEKKRAENREGLVYKNKSISDAQFTDIFEGDQLKNEATVDISKLQMFFFTVVIAVSYFLSLNRWVLENPPADLTALPTVSDGVLAMLGVSSAGYLGWKAVDWTIPKPK